MRPAVGAPTSVLLGELRRIIEGSAAPEKDLPGNLCCMGDCSL